MTILVADDDVISRLLIQRSLERAGFAVIAVDNGRLALEHLSRGDAPRLAVLDWMMPGLNGLDVCRAVRARRDQPYVYIILLTANESKADVIVGLEAGADDYLTKPCHTEELNARLRTGQRILNLQDQLYHDARHDALTHLPNRAQFLERLTQCSNRSGKDPGYKFALLFVDLNRFKAVNDTLGHAAGDELLIQVAERLGGLLRQKDCVIQGSDKAGGMLQSENTVARLGGDEFIVLMDGIRDAGDATGIAARIRTGLARPFHIAGRQVEIGASIGISFSEAGLTGSEAILKQADAAMYRSKASGHVEVSAEGYSPSLFQVHSTAGPAPASV